MFIKWHSAWIGRGIFNCPSCFKAAATVQNYILMALHADWKHYRLPGVFSITHSFFGWVIWMHSLKLKSVFSVVKDIRKDEIKIWMYANDVILIISLHKCHYKFSYFTFNGLKRSYNATLFFMNCKLNIKNSAICNTGCLNSKYLKNHRLLIVNKK